MFDKQISEFNNSLLNLTDFVELIEPVLIEKQKEHEEKLRPFVMVGLINKIFSQPDFKHDEQAESILRIKAKLIKGINSSYPGVDSVDIDQAIKDDTGISVRGVTIRGHADGIDDLLNDRKMHFDQLFRTAFISLISNVEWFYSQILHTYYDLFPERALLDNKSIQFKELSSFGSLQDARQYLIDQKIENILRDNVDGWFNTLKNDLNLGLGYYESQKEIINEIFQRRNLIIHNGGIVNSIYLNKVSINFRKDVKASDLIKVDKDYLNYSIGTLQLVFLLIAFELWKKQSPEDKERGELIHNIIYDNIKSSSWTIALGLSTFLIADKKMAVETLLYGQINFWLCKKRLGQNDETIAELRKHDFSDKKPIFQLALLVLKDEFDLAIPLLEEVFKREELTINKFNEFPIFEEFRLSQVYLEWREKTEIFGVKKSLRKKRVVR